MHLICVDHMIFALQATKDTYSRFIGQDYQSRVNHYTKCITVILFFVT